MSGGDLDGDIYFAMPEDNLKAQSCRLQSYDPMDYTPAVKVSTANNNEKKTTIEASDIGNFFIDYIKNDNLGRIASAHVVFADK
jgi:RNA-dependent RNA polymerase